MPKRHYVLVTGASKGIGKAAALHLDALGYTVFGGVRKQADADALTAEASDRLTPLMLDVTNDEQIAAAAEHIKGATGEDGLYGLVNNAGVSINCPVEVFPMADFRRQFEVNLFGQLAVTQAMLPTLRTARGRIINISSIGGKFSPKFLGAYAGSKHALEAMSDSLRMELMPWGMHVVSILPGAIKTPLWQASMQTADRIRSQISPEQLSLYRDEIEKGRPTWESMGENGIPPEAVAQAVQKALTATHPRSRYLVGNDAKFIYYAFRFLPERAKANLLYRVFAS